MELSPVIKVTLAWNWSNVRFRASFSVRVGITIWVGANPWNLHVSVVSKMSCAATIAIKTLKPGNAAGLFASISVVLYLAYNRRYKIYWSQKCK